LPLARRMNSKYVCECGDVFDLHVWHCLRCGGHSRIGTSHCQNCGRSPWRPGSTSLPFKDTIPSGDQEPISP
jgi:hypothetical protein